MPAASRRGRDPVEGCARRCRGDGTPVVKTSHTLNQVPFLVYAPDYKLRIDETVEKPGLSNAAGTVLHLLGFRTPEDFGKSLLLGE